LIGEDCVDYVVLGEPNTGKNYFRMGWIIFKSTLSGEELCSEIKRLRGKLEGTVIEVRPEHSSSSDSMRFELHVDAIGESDFTVSPLGGNSVFANKSKSTLPISSHPARMKKDLFHCRKLAAHFDRLLGVEHGLRGACTLALNSNSLDEAENMESIMTASEEQIKRALDLYVVYLRRVHYFCYYETCIDRFRSAEELIKRCGVHHWRRPSVDPVVEEKYGGGFCDRIDKTVEMILHGLDRNTLEQLGGRDVEKYYFICS
jgi:hypothetical protein